MDLICVTLGADTKNDRTKDSIKLIEYAYLNYQMIDLKFMIEDEFDDLVQTSRFNIVKGTNNNLIINLEKNNITLYPIKKENANDIKIETEIINELNAPVYENAEIGKLTVKIEDEVIYELNIYTSNYIPKKNVFDYYKYFISNMTKYYSFLR